jgi:hypothetical protein
LDGPYGGDGMFPKYSGYFFDTWSLAMQYSTKTDFKNQIAGYLQKLTEANVSQHKKFGFRPFSFNSGNYDTRQCLQMSFQIVKAAQRIKSEFPELSKTMMDYANLELDYFTKFVGTDLDKYTSRDPETIIYAYLVTKRPYFLSLAKSLADSYCTEKTPDILYNAGSAAKKIDCLDFVYQTTKEKKYLTAAERFADYAISVYMNDESALPKCVPADELMTVEGEKWRTFYYSHLGCDDLMFSLINLWLIQKKNPALSQLHFLRIQS